MKKNEETISIVDFLRNQKREIDKLITAFKVNKKKCGRHSGMGQIFK